jgi:hypothetical protein
MSLSLASGSGPVAFRNDVMAVLSKAGCNAGACHGNASGKGGFKLSLRGEDPEQDYVALTRDAFGRRVNPNDPEASLLLLKPTTQLTHEGGLRFDRASPEFAILTQWISAGAPMDPGDSPRLVDLEVSPGEQILTAPETEVQLNARAHFSDGTRRDVTRLAVYEPTRAGVNVSANGRVRAETFGEVTVLVRYLHEQRPVRLAFIPAREEYSWPGFEPRNLVDEHVFAKLRTLRIRPSPVAGDSIFMRRVYLDVLGVLPTSDEAREFVADTRCDKREGLIDALLQRPEFAEFWALKWSDLLRNEEKALDRKGVELFHRWIRESIATDKPVDQFVRELLTARGSTYENPPANFYRSLRALSSRAETVAQVFLGTRLLCAQCHNHPFDRWTQADYHDWSGIFARVNFKVLENRYPDGLDKHGFTGEQIVYATLEGDAKNPRTGAAALPRLLGADNPLPADCDRLGSLADWITSPDNPRFAKVQVNRIWYHLMGRGLVDPVDDFRATNPASHPGLLETLAVEFVNQGFSMRHVMRLILNSHTYQVDFIPDVTALDDEANYSHTVIRRLGAEQMLDALSHVAGVPLVFQGYPHGIRAGQIPGIHAVRVRRGIPGRGEQFLRVFGKPERLLASEEERSCETTLGQTFQLMTGPAITDLLQREGGRLDGWLASGEPVQNIVEELCWTALTRPPSPEESDALARHVNAAEDRRSGLQDAMWALMNSKEFILRR